MELPQRYKCRIREPWYRVPGVVRGELFLSKRSHHWPRVVVNRSKAYTTDTIYRGRMVAADRTAEDVAVSFQNTLTLLTAEMEGRSFGGGVHELVPSEIARLTTLIPAGVGKNALRQLDEVARSDDPQAILDATDRYLIAAGVLPADLLPLLRDARETLAARRFERNRRDHDESTLPVEAAA